jgi:hypothetical protein
MRPSILLAVLSTVVIDISFIGAAAKPASPPSKPGAGIADGKLWIVERRGRFVIKPDTLFCRAAVVDPKLKKILGPSYDGPNLDGSSVRAHLKKLQQSDYLNGSSRAGRSQAGKNCPNNGINIFVTGQTSLNAAGKPYRLELEARQGRSTVLKIEITRSNGLRPDWQNYAQIPNPYPPEWKVPKKYFDLYEQEVKNIALQTSISTDGKDIGSLLIEKMFEGELK